jgi:hypothetical protein
MALLITGTLRGEKNEFTFWYVYFILGTWLILVAYWLNRLDNGLKLFPPMFIIPVMQVFFVFFAIICGGLYFEEFLGFSVVQIIGFTAGVLMILSGVYGLAPTDMVLTTPDSKAPEESTPEMAEVFTPPSSPTEEKRPTTADTKAVDVDFGLELEAPQKMAHAGSSSTVDSKDPLLDKSLPVPQGGAPRHPAHTSTSSVAVISAVLHSHAQVAPSDGKDSGNYVSCPVATKKNRKIVKRKPLELDEQ